MRYNEESLSLFREVFSEQRFDRAANSVAAEFSCPADFPAFSGHFPGQPVLPAVMQLVFVRLMAADLLRTELETVRTGRMKFKGMIRPDEKINIQVNLEQIAEGWNAVFKLKKIDSVVASGSLVFRARP